MVVERLLRFLGIPPWTVWPGAEPHVRRRYTSLLCPYRQRSHFLPLPRAVVGVKRFLEVLFYWEIAWIIFGSFMSLLHMCILCYSSIYEGPHNDGPFFSVLAAMCGLSFFRVLCCCILLERVRDLRVVWWSRSVLGETVQLLQSACWQLDRLASCASFCALFAALHVMYNDSNCDMNTPVLCRYMSVIVLCFLSLLGPNVVLLLATVCCFICSCITKETQLAGMFVDEPVESYSLPARMLQKLKEEPWANLKCAITSASAPLYPGVFDAAICSICLCEYQPEELVRTLPCGHLFHSACIARWFKAHASCPLRCHINFCTGQLELPRRASTQAQSIVGEREERLASSLVLEVSMEPRTAEAGRGAEGRDETGEEASHESRSTATEYIRPSLEQQWNR